MCCALLEKSTATKNMDDNNVIKPSAIIMVKNICTSRQRSEGGEKSFQRRWNLPWMNKRFGAAFFIWDTSGANEKEEKLLHKIENESGPTHGPNKHATYAGLQKYLSCECS
jgi:hypothetical protein